jgi:hypothetical protein
MPPSRILIGASLALAITACATPSRRLSTRTVDDPAVLPGRMVEVSVDAAVSRDHPTDVAAGSVLPRIDYGLSDRLELADLLSLRYALLDDAPRAPERIAADPFRPRDPLSLSVRAGLTGIGYSTVEGLIVLPVVEVVALEHLGAATTLALQLGWSGQWVGERALFPQPYGYNDRLWPTAPRRSQLTASVIATRQLTDHLSLSLAGGLHEAHAGLGPWRAWGASGGSLELGAAVRPWPWLTLRAAAFAGARVRPDGLGIVASPAEPLARQLPESVTWVGASGGAAFRW